MAMSANINRCFLATVLVEKQNKSPYSQKKLSCKGRACAQCGKCRDWYWVGYYNWLMSPKDYTKRHDATCVGCCGGFRDDRYDYDCCFGGGSYYHYFFACCCFGRHCECDDNGS